MKPLHIGIVGMGYAGGRQMAAAAGLSGARIVAVSDQRPLENVPPDVRLCPEWRDLVLDPNVHAVSICLPHFLHERVAQAAIEANKHVLVEKPLACTLAEAQGIADRAAERGVVLMVELTHRYYKPIRAARRLLAEQRLGRLLAVEDRIIESIPPTFPAWLTRRSEAGGGVGLTNAVHMLDRVAHVTGEPLAFEAGIAGAQQALGDIEDTAAMQLRLTGGAPVQALAQWRRGDRPAIDDELTLYGSKATLRVWAWRGWRLEPIDGAPIEETCYDRTKLATAEVAQLAMTDALQAFCEAVASDQLSHPTVGGALAAQRLIELFYEAAASERSG